MEPRHRFRPENLQSRLEWNSIPDKSVIPTEAEAPAFSTQRSTASTVRTFIRFVITTRPSGRGGICCVRRGARHPRSARPTRLSSRPERSGWIGGSKSEADLFRFNVPRLRLFPVFYTRSFATNRLFHRIKVDPSTPNAGGVAPPLAQDGA